jgi:hypothetical protein
LHGVTCYCLHKYVSKFCRFLATARPRTVRRCSPTRTFEALRWLHRREARLLAIVAGRGEEAETARNVHLWRAQSVELSTREHRLNVPGSAQGLRMRTFPAQSEPGHA